MGDEESETKKSCFCCACCASCDCIEYFKRKYVPISLAFVGWAVTVFVFIIIEDPDWNIAVIPYFFAFVACALVAALCERGRYDHDRLGDTYRLSSLKKKIAKSLEFREVPDSEVSPLLSGQSRNVTEEIPLFRADPRPLEHAEELFEPVPVVLQGSDVGRRDSQVTVQADVHRPVHDSPSPKTQSPQLAGPSTASKSDPHHSSTTPDSGVPLQSTGQSTQSEDSIPRPPTNPEQLQQDPISPLEKLTKF